MQKRYDGCFYIDAYSMDALNLEIVKRDVENAITEDVGDGDLTAKLLPENKIEKAVVLAREAFLLAGSTWFDMTFHLLDADVKLDWHYRDGDEVKEDAIICTLSGQARSLLTGERIALNFLQMLSGVATQTHQYCQALNGEATLLDTRKTLPGLRYAQKYAVKCGGGANHRFGLYDAIMIKENHIRACGGIANAVNKAKTIKKANFVEVEVENLEEFQEALGAKPDVIMLDNFDIDMMRQAVALRGQEAVKLEASGNVNLDSIASIAKTGVDSISVGALTKSVKSVDLSLLIKDV